MRGELYIILSIVLDEAWARQEKRKTFNWVSLFDDVTIAALATVQITYVNMLASSNYVYPFPWVLATVVVVFSGITATTAMKIPSLLSGIILVPAFTVLMACVHDYARTERKILSRLGMLFTVGYAVLISFNYYTQLTLVRQNLYTDPFAMDNPQSVMWVIEVLGYGFMGLATFFTAWVFNTGRLESAIRWLFITNGVLGIGGMIGYALGLSMDILLGGLVAWDIVMPVLTILLAILFRRTQEISR